MPVLTRSKRRLLSGDGDLTRTDESSKKLADITNRKQSKLTSKSQKVNSKEEKMSVNEQKTMEVPLRIAGRKRKASQSGGSVDSRQEAIDVAKKSRSAKSPSGSSGSQSTAHNTSENHNDLIEMLQKIKRMHDENFKNVAERLQLDPVPSCLYDLKKCHDTHHPKNAAKMISNTTKTTVLDALSIDTRIWRFTHNVRHNVLGLNIFPGSDVLSKVLEKILVSIPNYLFIKIHLINLTILEIEPKYGLQHEFHA